MDFLKNIDFGALFGKIKDLLGKVDWGSLLSKVKPYLSKAGDFVKKSPSLFLSLLLFLTVAVDPPAESTPTARLAHEEIKTVIDTTFMSRGLTNDGNCFYTSGAVSFAKYTALARYNIRTMKREKYKIFPVGWDLIKKGYDNIGGISYFDGKIYAAMESVSGRAAPCIAVFGADSLAYETSFELPNSWFPDGIGWVAVNPNSGLLYTANAGEADSIHAFRIDATMAHYEQIDLDTTIRGVRGGTFDDEYKLYLSVDSDSKYKEVLRVDPYTGVTETAFLRNVGKADAEAGDITYFENWSDNSTFHVTDYNGILSVYLRSYSMVNW